MRHLTYVFAALLALTFLASCSKDGPPPPAINLPPSLAPSFAASVTPVGAGEAFEIDVLRGLTDPEGDDFNIVEATPDLDTLGSVTISGSGKTLTFTPNQGVSGVIVITYTVEDALGNRVSSTVTLNIVASASLNLDSGDGQSGISGSALSPFVVRVEDGSNNPLRGAYVTFVVSAGNGALSTTKPQITDAQGLASTTLTLGDLGSNIVSASMTGAANSPMLFSATANAALALTTTAFDAGSTGNAYAGSTTLMASGGFPPYTFARTGGDALPSGLSLSAAGVMTGTPAAGTQGSYSFTMQATDSLSNTASGTVTLAIADGIAPDAPASLAASYSGVTDTILLSFTAPGGDAAIGAASSYLIRTSTSDITNEGEFNAADDIPTLITPKTAGSTESIQVPAAWFSGDRYFAVRAIDAASNQGAISSSLMINTDATGTFPSSAIAFGTVSIGGSASQMLSVTNTAALVKLTLNSVTTGGDPVFTIGGSTTNASIAPGATHMFSVDFAPTAAVTSNETLTISHNASNATSPINLALSGTGTNSGPTIVSASASPSAVQPGASTTLSVVASDSNSNLPGVNDITSVTVDLSAFGGSAAQALTFDGNSGNPQTGTYSFALLVPALQTINSYMIPVTVTDASSATVNGNISLTVNAAPNAKPTITMSVFVPASVSAGATATLTIRVNDADSDFGNSIDDITSVVADMTSGGGPAAQAIPRTSTPTNTTGEYTFAVDTTSTAANIYTIAITATDSAAQTVMANAQLTVTNAAPTITAATFTPATVASGTNSTLDVTVNDLNSSATTNDVASVTVDATSLGGSAAQAMTFVGRPSDTTATYTATISTTGAAVQAHSLTVTATDAASATATNTPILTVTQGSANPTINSSSQSPAAALAFQGVEVTLTVNVVDANSNNPTTNDIASVVMDLTQLGLAPNYALSFNSGASSGTTSVYNTTLKTFGLPTGTFSLPVTAKDSTNATVSGNVSMTITETFGKSPELLYEYPKAASNVTMAYSARNHKMVFVFSKPISASSVELNSTNGETLMSFGRAFGTPTSTMASNIAGMTNRILVYTLPQADDTGTVTAVLLSKRIVAPGIGAGIADADGNFLVPGFADSYFNTLTLSSVPTGSCIGLQWPATATVDNSAPTISSRSPAQNSSNSSSRAPIHISFNEVINPATLAANFTVTDGTGAVAGSVHIDPSNLMDVWFEPSRDYNGTVSVNVNDVEDLGGNKAASTNYTFSHNADTVAPVISNLTVNDIPDYINGSAANGGASPGDGIMRVARSGFTIDITYSDNGGAGISLDRNDISLKASQGVTGNAGAISANQELIGQFAAADVLITKNKATLLVPSTLLFPTTGTTTLTVQVKDAANNQSTAATFNVESRDAVNAKIPFENTENWHFVFDRDHERMSLAGAASNKMTTTGFDGTNFYDTAIDANSKSDFEESLEANGLRSGSGSSQVNSTGSLSMNDAVTNWVKNRILYYNYRFYGLNVPLTDSNNNPFFAATLNSNPTNASDGVNMHFQSTAAANTTGAQARMAFGGIYIQGVLGNAAFDVPNDFHNEDNGVSTANTDRGIFTIYDVATEFDGSPDDNGSLFRSFFYPTLPFAAASGTVLGASSHDKFVVDPAQNPASFGSTSGRDERYQVLLAAMDAFALQWARVSAHEVGHSIGLIADGAPGGGLYGGLVAAFPGTTSGHVDLNSFYIGSGQNVMSPAGGMRHSFSRFTAFNQLAMSYLLHTGVFN